MGNCLGKPEGPAGGSSQQAKQSNDHSNKTGKAGAAGTKPKKDWGLGDRYEMIKFLGRGGTSDAYLFRDKTTKETVAIKLIPRPIPPVLKTSILREISIQAELGWGHHNVIKAYEAILTPTHFALVMEFASGGSLTSYVSERFSKANTTGLFLNEDEARYFFRQFIEAVQYCHSNNVAHRDLKLDNTLLDSHDPPYVKLCDFGFARQWESTDANMQTHIGTPVYMAPELVQPDHLPGLGGEESKVTPAGNGKKGYDGRKVDVWASGILLLVMLLGTFPFDHVINQDPNAKEAHLEIWMQQMQQRWSDIPRVKKSLERLSPEIKDLLDAIFVVDEAKRITVDEIKEHPWYNKPLPEPYKKAWESMRKKQEELDNSRKDLQRNEQLKQARYKKLENLVNMASKRADLSAGLPPTVIVSLLEDDVLKPSAAAEGLMTVSE